MLLGGLESLNLQWITLASKTTKDTHFSLLFSLMSQHLGHPRKIQGLRNLRGPRNFQKNFWFRRNSNYFNVSKVLKFKNSHYTHFQVSEFSNYSTVLKRLARSQKFRDFHEFQGNSRRPMAPKTFKQLKRLLFKSNPRNLSCLKNSMNFETLAMQFTFSTLPSSARGNQTKPNIHTCATVLPYAQPPKH